MALAPGKLVLRHGDGTETRILTGWGVLTAAGREVRVAVREVGLPHSLAVA